jgi:hypothetical protein
MALVAVLSFALVACGSDPGDGVATLQGGEGSASPSASPSVDPEDALADFAQCMRDKGIEDFPDPQVDEDGRISFGGGGGGGQAPEAGDFEEIQDAMEACRDLLPQDLGPGDISPEQQAEFQDALLHYAQCMRDNGIEMPDPEFGEGGQVFQIGGPGMDPEDPDFQAADEACRHFLEEVIPSGGPDAG